MILLLLWPSSGWWYEGGGIYRHVHLYATNLVHIAPDGVRTYSNVTGQISSGPKTTDGHRADSVFTAAVTIVNQDTSSPSITYRATLLDASGMRGSVRGAFWI